jgi:hypothetical protein
MFVCKSIIVVLCACVFLVEAFSSSISSSSSTSSITADVIIYSANAAGIAAGIAAASSGNHSVYIFEPLTMIGGMAVAGGVGLMNNEGGVYGQGLGGQWCALNGDAYNSSGKPNCFPEMHIGEASFWKMINATTNLSISLGCHLISVDHSSACVTSATFLCNDGTTITANGKAFIDASYDGDLMILAGVSHTSGRESSIEYNESLAGVSVVDHSNEAFGNLDINPYWPDGSLLTGISSEPLPPSGTGDDRLMAFSYFICAAEMNSGKAISWPRPDGYNASDFELLRRVIAKYIELNKTFELQDFSEYQAYSTPPNITKLLLCCGRAPINMDQPDLNRGWATATYEERLEMEAAHRYYLLGSLYFMANDSNVNNYTRYAISRWGMCSDEYVNNNNFPPQLYIRISNRMKGVEFLTQNNLWGPRNNSIAVGRWDFDQHTESRRAVVDPKNSSRFYVINEGYFRLGFGPTGQQNWYDLPYGAICPKVGEANNLLVPVALSASSVAYSSTRIEQMYVDAGAAAGVAIALALETSGNGKTDDTSTTTCPGLSVVLQNVNVTQVQDELVLRYKQRIHGP